MVQVIPGVGKAKAPMHIATFHKTRVHLAAVLINIISKSIRKIQSSKTFHV